MGNLQSDEFAYLAAQGVFTLGFDGQPAFFGQGGELVFIFLEKLDKSDKSNIISKN